MGVYSLFSLLFIIGTCHIGYGSLLQPYEVINFKIPQAIWRKALHPTPVLKSPVTITIPVNVQDYDNDADELVDEEIPELNEPVVADATPGSQDPLPVVNDPTIPVVNDPAISIANDPIPPVVVTPSAPVQDEIVTVAPPLPGQVIRLPCQCRNRQCGCCSGTFLQRYSMKACGNITFIPEDFVFDVNMNVNNKTVVRRRVSASDPPPICFNPRRAPFVQVCAEISNIQIRNKNIHACFNIKADIGDFPVYSASFRCFNFGASGLQTGKKPRPVSSSGPKPVNLFGNSASSDDGGGGGFFENTVGTVFGENGLFGGGSSSSDDGPFDGLGDALGGFLDFE